MRAKSRLEEHVRYSFARHCYRQGRKDSSRNWKNIFKSFWGVSLDDYIKYAVKHNLKGQYSELDCQYTENS